MTEESKEMVNYDYGEDEGSGFENTTAADFKIPYIKIMQKQSKEVEADDTLKPGMILETGTMTRYDGEKGISIIPCLTDHNFVEMIPLEKGGGIVGVHAINSQIVLKAIQEGTFGKYQVGENDLIETYYLYAVLIPEDQNPVPCIVLFSGTKIIRYQAFITKAKGLKIPATGKSFPLFSHVYKLVTIKEKNNFGTYFNWNNIEFDGENAEAVRLNPANSLYQAAKGFKEMVNAGKAVPDDINKSGDIPF